MLIHNTFPKFLILMEFCYELFDLSGECRTRDLIIGDFGQFDSDLTLSCTLSCTSGAKTTVFGNGTTFEVGAVLLSTTVLFSVWS